jgi:twitching motility protein PilT
MPTSADLLFGRIAVKNQLVDEGKVRECLVLLDKNGGAESLGKFLVAKGYLNASQYKAISSHVEKVAGAARSPAGSPRSASLRASQKASSRKQRAGGARSAQAASGAFCARDIAQRDFSKLAGGPLDAYLTEARRIGASDFHFQVDAPPFVRLHGELVYLKHPVLRPEDTEPRIFEILTEEQKTIFRKHNDVDFSYEASHGRYRANACRQRKGFDAVFRLIPSQLPTLESLHLPPVLRRFTEYRQGIVLITGPAGSGKTATMAALTQMINERQHDHIVIVEEPIEYIVESKSCSVTQRNVRQHTESFASALRTAMRADPDYICVGEMRDLETVSMAITAAETGHLVLGTLHTTNAVRSIDRLIDVFPPKEQEQIRAMVSESMRGVISQQLLPRADGLGREPALEIMFATSAVANMIREKKTFQLSSVLQTGTKLGMVTMDDSIAALLQKKLITRSTAAFFAEDSSRFSEKK